MSWVKRVIVWIKMIIIIILKPDSKVNPGESLGHGLRGSTRVDPIFFKKRINTTLF
jgi:hypothetical protein